MAPGSTSRSTTSSQPTAAPPGAPWQVFFANGNAVTVDGAPNAGNFSLPEMTIGPNGPVFYFSTTDSAGNVVVATNAAASVPVAPVPTLSRFMQTLLALALAGVALRIIARSSQA